MVEILSISHFIYTLGIPWILSIYKSFSRVQRQDASDQDGLTSCSTALHPANMQARAVVFALTVLSCFAVSHAALSTEEIIDSIRLLTLDVKPMQNAADSINDESGQRILVGDGPFPKVRSGRVHELLL